MPVYQRLNTKQYPEGGIIMSTPDTLIMDEIIKNALMEDMRLGDITTDNLIPADSKSRAFLIARQNGVLAGLPVFRRVFDMFEQGIEFEIIKSDGNRAGKGDILIKLFGNTSTILKGERTALNFLQRMSGIATTTSEFVEKVKDISVKIADTRKTTPGLRLLEKYAVRMGGGSNHRMSLSDGVLIKDNHIAACGGITQAVTRARKYAPHTTKIEVETETLDQVREALSCKADIIMLDNMSTVMMKEAVGIIAGKAVTEASGDVNIDNVREIALTGVDIISIGKITHSAAAFNISLEIEQF